MNYRNSQILMLITALVVMSCGGRKEVTKELNTVTFTNDTNSQIFQDYLHIKQALVNSDVKEVKATARDMVDVYSDNQIDLKKLTKELGKTDNIDDQREVFYVLSQRLESMLKSNVSGGKIYKQYCPMAFNNGGAYWFSEDKQIENPYFGKNMLNCGSISDTIK